RLRCRLSLTKTGRIHIARLSEQIALQARCGKTTIKIGLLEPGSCRPRLQGTVKIASTEPGAGNASLQGTIRIASIDACNSTRRAKLARKSALIGCIKHADCVELVRLLAVPVVF